jgi:hypothetical protein
LGRLRPRQGLPPRGLGTLALRLSLLAGPLLYSLFFYPPPSVVVLQRLAGACLA